MRPRLYSTRALPKSFSAWASPGQKHRHADPKWFLFSLRGTWQVEPILRGCLVDQKAVFPSWPKTWAPFPRLASHQDLCCTLPASITLAKTLLMLKVCVQQRQQPSAQSDGKTVKKTKIINDDPQEPGRSRGGLTEDTYQKKMCTGYNSNWVIPSAYTSTAVV